MINNPTPQDDLREKLADIIDEAIRWCADSTLCGERDTYAGHEGYKEADMLLALIEAEAARREREARIDEGSVLERMCHENGPYIHARELTYTDFMLARDKRLAELKARGGDKPHYSPADIAGHDGDMWPELSTS